MPEKTPAPQKAKRFRRGEASEYLKTEWGLSYASRTLAKMASVSSDGPPMEYDGRRPFLPAGRLRRMGGPQDWTARPQHLRVEGGPLSHAHEQRNSAKGG